MLTVGKLKAQIVTNGSFEGWTSSIFQIPAITPTSTPFSSSNTRTFLGSGVSSVIKVPGNGSSGYAMKVETAVYNKGKDTTTGYGIWGGEPGNGGNLLFPGGFPFNDQNATGIQADLMYSISAGQAGYIFVQFKKNGQPIGGSNGLYGFQVTGTQSTFSTSIFTFSPALPSAPDTCVIAFASDNPTGKGTPGDYMVIDNIVFLGTSQTVPDGNLDTWVNDTINVPTGWNQGGNDGKASVYRTTDAHSGTYAAAFPVADSNNAQLILGQNTCSNGGGNGNCTEIPGMSLGGVKPTYLGFYYKMSSPGLDTANVRVVFTNWNSTLNIRDSYTYEFDTLLVKNSSYTYTKVLFTGNHFDTASVDSVYIEIDASYSSKNNSNGAVNGSLLLIDDMSFDGLTPDVTGIFAPTASASGMNVYPSPTSSMVTVELSTDIANITVLNTLQQEVGARVVSISGNKAVVDLSTLDAGLYIIRTSDGQTMQAQKIIKQ